MPLPPKFVAAATGGKGIPAREPGQRSIAVGFPGYSIPVRDGSPAVPRAPYANPAPASSEDPLGLNGMVEEARRRFSQGSK